MLLLNDLRLVTLTNDFLAEDTRENGGGDYLAEETRENGGDYLLVLWNCLEEILVRRIYCSFSSASLDCRL